MLRVGIVGCGNISRMYCDVYASIVDLAQVVAMSDPIKDLAINRIAAIQEAYLAESHVARHQALDEKDEVVREALLQRAKAATSAAETKISYYRDYNHLLHKADIDVMVVLTPPAIRLEPTVAAAQAGKHIFIQGPMATTLADADTMVKAVQTADVQFHSQCGARYPRDMVLARHAVENGALGTIGSASVQLNWFRGQGYYRGWHGTWDGEGGGTAFHLGRYIIDPYLWVVGSPVVELFAYSGPMLRQIETESLTQAVLRFSNGSTGTLHASVLNHKQLHTPEGRFEILGREASMLVNEEYYISTDGHSAGRDHYWKAITSFGSSGAGEFGDGDGDGITLQNLETLRKNLNDVPICASEAYQTRLFVECILNDSDPLVPIDIPRHHVEVVRAMYSSAEQHRPVTLPLDPGDPFYGTARLSHGVRRP